MTEKGNPRCSSCNKPIGLDDDFVRSASDLIHEDPVCIAKHLEKLSGRPGHEKPAAGKDVSKEQ